jgi:hypothetical protein
MKTLYIILAIILLSTIACVDEIDNKSNNPNLEVENRITTYKQINFGYVPFQDSSIYEFHIKNNVDFKLIIEDIEKSELFSISEIKGKEIAPNDSLKLSIQFKPVNDNIPLTIDTIKILTNYKIPILIEVKGFSQNNTSLIEQEADLGFTTLGDSTKKKFYIKNKLNENLTLLSQTQTDVFRITNNLAKSTIAPNDSIEVEIEYKASNQNLKREEASIKINTDYGLPIWLHCYGTSRYDQFDETHNQLKIETLNFGEVIIGESKTDSISITNNFDFPVTINQAEFSSEVFTIVGEILTTIEGNSSKKIAVKFEPSESKPYQETIILKTPYGANANSIISGNIIKSEFIYINRTSIPCYTNISSYTDTTEYQINDSKYKLVKGNYAFGKLNNSADCQITINPFDTLYIPNASEIKTIGALSFNNNSEIDDNIFHNCINVLMFSRTFSSSKITSIKNWFANNKKVEAFDWVFFDCQELTEIPSDLFINNINVKYFNSTFYNCKKINSISPNLFYKNINTENFTSTFEGCSAISSLDENLFIKNTKVKDFSSVFSDCTTLSSIPENIFNYNTLCRKFYQTFEYCTTLTEIPEMLFKNNIEAIDFSSTFSNCDKIIEIPENLFKYNTKAISFNYTFASMDELLNIPPNIFRYNTDAQSFRGILNSSKKITNIPVNLFATNTKAIDFSSAFSHCEKLSTIPENLFANNIEAKYFGDVFKNCSLITQIPENLFTNNKKATNFGGTFSQCNINSIPQNLFKHNPMVQSFNTCFSENSNLASIPSKLFKYNINVEDYTSTFKSCSNINSVPDSLFFYNSKSAEFYQVFHDCGVNEINTNIFDTNWNYSQGEVTKEIRNNTINVRFTYFFSSYSNPPKKVIHNGSFNDIPDVIKKNKYFRALLNDVNNYIEVHDGVNPIVKYKWDSGTSTTYDSADADSKWIAIP